jgi:hypothetical protein
MNLQILKPSDFLWSEALQTLRHDFYHLPQYMELEARRLHATPEAILLTDGDCIFFLPYLVRKCSDVFNGTAQNLFDIVSPNGYAGILLNQAAVSQLEFVAEAMKWVIQVFSDRQICSAFLRLHPILNHRFDEVYPSEACTANVETVVIDLQLSEAELWQQTRENFRSIIKKRKREGFVARMVPAVPYIDRFTEIYTETMDRVNASKSFYFGQEYFRQCAEQLREYLHICIVEFKDQVVCAGLFTECCGMIQYHLGGTRTQFLKQSPNVLMQDCVRFWAKERGNEVMHLGGGVSGSKDSLFHFKIGFSQTTLRLPLLRLITNAQEYRRLVELHAKVLQAPVEQLLETSFFPAYRSPASRTAQS